MDDKISFYVIKSSRDRYLKRLTLLNDRDKREYPFTLIYETRDLFEALKFDSDITAQAIADFLSESKDESFFITPLI